MLSRLKFEIRPLVEEMLDRLPEDIWRSKTTTFFDPAIGGGQFVSAIEGRLAKYGHSKENIASRVYGCEDHRRTVKYAIRRHNLVGRYWACDFLNEKFDMKFDVIIGNPPYQSPKGNGSKPIYRKIIEECLKLSAIDGIVAMVTPPGILNTSDINEPGAIFKKLKAGNLSVIDLSTNKFFPGIGSPICYFIWGNCLYEGFTLIDGNRVDITDLNFITRIFNEKTQSIINAVTKKGNQTLGTLYRKDKEIDRSKPRVCFKELNHISNKVNNLKPIILKGNEDSDDYYSFVRVCNSFDEAVSLHSYLGSKLVSFFNYIIRYNNVLHNGVIGRITLPPLTHTWTDQELYDHFGLTQEEIDYVEANIK